MSPDQVGKKRTWQHRPIAKCRKRQLGAEVIVGWYKIPPIDGIEVTTSMRFSEFESRHRAIRNDLLQA